jgi:la-related protein 4
VGDELKQAIKRQVEFYFSKANLATDAFLVSQMNSQMYVPVDVIVDFAKVKALTDSTELLVESIKDSKLVSLNTTNDAIKPNIKSERNTIILREIPSATKPEDVEAIFTGCGGKVESVRSDVGDTWFVTMASEEEAVATLLALRSKTFNDAPIKARLKSENTLKSFFPSQPAESAVAPGASYGGRGYYGAAPTGYYDVPNHYGVQYNATNARAPYSNSGDSRYTQRGPGGRGAQAPASTGGQYQRQQGGRGNSAAQQQQPKDAKSGATPSTKKQGKDGKKAAAAATKQPQGQAPASNGTASKKASSSAASATTPAERQPILSASNFPPLPAGADKPGVNAPIKHSYHHEDIMEIVKNMDENDCKLPEGKMEFDAHPAALTSVAHPDLLRNQRTYSIEQAREAMRQGRPIRSDSVGSIDYESMMYGEDYTKEARELRKQNSTDGAAAAATGEAKETKDAAPKIFSFASAVINGTPVEVAPKKKPAASAAAAAAPASGDKTKAATKVGKDEKKTGGKKTGGKTPDSKKAAAVDETLPKAGAWGGRNFLDVVKSEPVVPAPAAVQPPAAPFKTAAAAPAQDAPKKSDAKVWERNAKQ